MRLHTCLPILLLPLGALLAPAEQPRFAVEAKTRLTKTFTVETHLASTAFRLKLDGEDLPEGHTPKLQLGVEGEETYVFVDVYGAPEEGRPSTLTRTFETLSDETTETLSVDGHDGASQSNETLKKRGSGLEGKTVRFTWDPAQEQYDAALVGGEGDADLLDELVEDTDLRAFLPGKRVSDGDTWTIPAKAFRVLSRPGGDLGMVAEGEDGKDEAEKRFSRELEDNMDGEATGTFKGLREVDGHSLGVIAVKASMKSNAEGEFAGEEGSSGRSLELEIEIEGEILWDLKAGHVRSFELKGPVRVRFANTRQFEGPNGEMELRREFDLEGEVIHRLSVEG